MVPSLPLQLGTAWFSGCSWSRSLFQEWRAGCTGAQVVAAVSSEPGLLEFPRCVRLDTEAVLTVYWAPRRQRIRLGGVGFVMGTP